MILLLYPVFDLAKVTIANPSIDFRGTALLFKIKGQTFHPEGHGDHKGKILGIWQEKAKSKTLSPFGLCCFRIRYVIHMVFMIHSVPSHQRQVTWCPLWLCGSTMFNNGDFRTYPI